MLKAVFFKTLDHGGSEWDITIATSKDTEVSKTSIIKSKEIGAVKC